MPIADSVFDIDDHLTLALCDVDQAKKLVLASGQPSTFIPGIPKLLSGHGHARPPSLADIYLFGQKLQLASFDGRNRKHIVVCGGQDPFSITNMIAGIGGFLLLFRGMKLDTLEESLKPILNCCIGYAEYSHSSKYMEEINVLDCFQALDCARNQGWIKFGVSQDLSLDYSPHCLDMEVRPVVFITATPEANYSEVSTGVHTL
mmetsp:Transcript_34396/g.90851  ORF Transcript_34396/g.90851 Transcript_34396/m.90851 type:complete len:203 (-) Transcript_34396:325-933(-)